MNGKRGAAVPANLDFQFEARNELLGAQIAQIRAIHVNDANSMFADRRSAATRGFVGPSNRRKQLIEFKK